MSQATSKPHPAASIAEDEAILGFETPVSDIHTQLSHLWKDQARTRASMMNFAIYEESPGALVRNSEVLAEITAEHACRGILIEALPAEPEDHLIRAWVTAHCQLRGGKKSVCSEQLAFLLKAPHADLVRNTVFAHLDSDLPLVLWWRGELTDHFEERFYSVIDRLIIDSSTWKDPLPQFERLESAYLESSTRFAVNDLAWSRSYHQRVALASLFEDSRLASGLGSIRNITVSHKSGNRVPALMLAAWIISRLGLSKIEETPETEAGGIVFQNGNGGTVHVRFEDSGVAGRTAINSVELSDDGWRVSLVRRTESQFIHSFTEVAGQSSESFFPADVKGEAKLISSILSRRGMNRLYFEIIPLLKKFLKVPSGAVSTS